MVVVFDPAGADAFALPKAAASRALLYVLTILVVAYLLALQDKPRPAAWMWFAGLFTVAGAIATALAVDPYVAAFGAPHRLLGLTAILDGVALMASIAILVRSPRDLAAIAAASLLAFAVVLAYAALQVLRLDPMGWVDPTVSSTVGNSTTFAAYAMVGAVTLLAGVLFHWDALGPPSRLALVGISAVAVVEALLAGARGPAIGFLVGLVVIAAFLRRVESPWLAGRRPLMMAALFALAALAVVMSPTGQRLRSMFVSSDESVTERTIVYATAAQAIRQRPLLGVGPDGLVTVYQKLRPSESAQLTQIITPGQTSSHSWLLHQLVGTGVLGTGALLALLAVVSIRGWRVAGQEGRSHSLLATIGIITLLTEGLVTINSIVTDTYLWALAGIALAPAVAPGGVHGLTRYAWTRSDLVRLGAVLLPGLMLASMTTNVLVANRALHESNAARGRAEFGLAVSAAQEAIRRDPGRADHWNVLGLAYAGRDPDRAAAAFREAADRAPYDAVYLLNLAAEEARLGERGSASHRARSLAHARAALEIDPLWPTTIRRASEVYAVAGDFDVAVRLAEQLVSIQPSFGNFDWSATVHAAAGKTDVAIEHLRRRLELQYGTGPIPLIDRLRLARLYARAGNTAEARSILSPPTVTSASYSCQPRNGFVQRAERLPRCFVITFEIEEELQPDPARPGAATHVESYSIDGRPLPHGSAIVYEGGRSVIVQLPTDALPPLPGAQLTIQGVSDLYGNVVRPDPARVLLQ